MLERNSIDFRHFVCKNACMLVGSVFPRYNFRISKKVMITCIGKIFIEEKSLQRQTFIVSDSVAMIFAVFPLVSEGGARRIRYLQSLWSMVSPRNDNTKNCENILF